MKKVFISHVYNYKDHYMKIVKEINDSEIKWENCSIDEHNLIDSNITSEIKHEIETNIEKSSNVVILAGIYASHSNWIEWEYNIAVRHGKKIIAVKPWGRTNMPSFLSKSDYQNLEIVGWNPSLIPDKL